MRRDRTKELADLSASLNEQLGMVNAAREKGLPACRKAIRESSRSIRAVHRLQPDEAAAFLNEARDAIQDAQQSLQEFPAVAFAGFLHDAEKEYAEAVLTRALVDSSALPSPADIGVQVPAWLNGLAEAASELRRHLLDRLREGDMGRTEELLAAMEDVYDQLVTFDYPDAITGGLRRTTDALRAVLERTRGDVTTTVLQVRLQAAIEASASK